MRQLLLLLTLLAHSFLAQGQATPAKPGDNGKKVSFETKIDIAHATKDGIYLNGYVVNIPYNKLVELNGSTVRISGRVTVVKGLKNYEDQKVRQGRYEDAKHILKPRLRVIKSH